LLQKATTDDQLIISSVCDNVSGDRWAEIDADGIYMVDLGDEKASCNLEEATAHIPAHDPGQHIAEGLGFVGKSLCE
jgi:hypothetical protein